MLVILIQYFILKAVPSHMQWTQIGGHFCHVEAHSCGVVWALGEDGTVWIHNGFYGGGFFKGFFGSIQGMNSMNDESNVYVYENQRWNPVHGFSARGLPTDRASWSDATGRLATNKDNTCLPNRHWNWVLEKLDDLL